MDLTDSARGPAEATGCPYRGQPSVLDHGDLHAVACRKAARGRGLGQGGRGTTVPSGQTGRG